ncbi:MAG: ribosome-associated translation inhibitor RaiA [Clostridia bacterium]|nr:ribosome-associated translation inhibitor RaiA [Clostridia bacterium]
MTINYDKRRIDIDGAQVASVEKKLSKLSKFFEDDAVADVKFTETRGRVVAEITIRNNRMYFRAEERAQDALSATDGAVDSIMRQIRKNKTKLEKKLRTGAFEPAAEEAVASDEELVRRKQFDLKPMSEQDALLQMDMLNHKFYVFRNSDAGNAVCVCYKRDDGGYGIIETV